tara:strand:- start:231 stop:461 length:231 start_codon:yes stop_codon:yes gene_type:complete
MEKKVWIFFALVSMVVFKFVDMHFLQWFGDDLFPLFGKHKNPVFGLLWFLSMWVFFASILVVIIAPVLKMLHESKK